MKLAVINYSGNVGKTTVSRHLLAPRLPGCQVVAVESINADDGQPVTIRGRQFAQLQEFLQSVDNVVVDIGASNVEELLKLMRRYQDSQEDFDGYVVPTAPDRKQQQDTAATLAELARIGVAPERLRVWCSTRWTPMTQSRAPSPPFSRTVPRRVSRNRMWRRSSRSTRCTRSFAAPGSRWLTWPTTPPTTRR
jgi:hypothetical protein